ncbi:flavodoxin [uncultured Megasphaera sp.]|uniref:flavodoxin n=1 Tax=uncultured Megasphaera sp. TaxID=165188 RepID=UPI00265D07D2|nr:flavodoxin [uncultured Megasphaera sp.]
MKVGGILIAVALAVTIVWAFVSYPRPAEFIQAVAPERILIAYYSQSGHTEAVAKAIQQETGGDLYRIRTNISYPKNAPAMQSQVKAEYNEGLRPPLAEPMPDMSRYDVVLLGFPNWYNAPPVGVFTFLEGTDWKGKTVVPFVTYGLSGWGSSIDDIREAAPNAAVAKGLAVHASQAGHCRKAVASWLDSLGLDAIQGGRNR